MKKIICSCCGSNDFMVINGYRICNFCNTKYRLTKEDLNNSNSKIALNEDVCRLLELCEKDRYNAKKYANLILDIDPTNKEALKYL